jgi:hypothetical protein
MKSRPYPPSGWDRALLLCVFDGASADKYASRAFAQLIRILARIFKRFPTDLEQQPLLWVESTGFTGRDPEEGAIERLHIAQKGCALYVRPGDV